MRCPASPCRLCGSLSIQPAKSESSTLRRTAAMISSMILLRELLQVGPAAEQFMPRRYGLLHAQPFGQQYRVACWRNCPNIYVFEQLVCFIASLQVLPVLAEALAPAECQLLRAVGSACGHAAFGELRGLLDEALEEDAQSAKNSFLNRHAAFSSGALRQLLDLQVCFRLPCMHHTLSGSSVG